MSNTPKISAVIRQWQYLVRITGDTGLRITRYDQDKVTTFRLFRRNSENSSIHNISVPMDTRTAYYYLRGWIDALEEQ